MSTQGDLEFDPAKESSSHSVGAGIGAVVGGSAGAVAGALVGPAGMLAGGVAGAVMGGLGGRAIDRIDAHTAPGGSQSSDVSRAHADSGVIETLNDLLETCRDGEYGFQECADHTEAPHIKTVLARRAEECHMAGAELQALIKARGGEVGTGGSFSGTLHRGWVSMKGTLSGYSDLAMLDESERGEDAAVASYRKALQQYLPDDAKLMVQRQAQGAERNHDQVRALRDTLKAAR